MQRYAILFITVNALHVSGGFSAHHQELKTVNTASGICQACLLLPLAVAANNRVPSQLQLTNISHHIIYHEFQRILKKEKIST
jgi:hypothetical protein